ncbi:MAG: M14 family zinc carboxypeptidase [Bacteroidetes bacterium]|nr:M14 family zinc carboxypeptidase [Bacteroidota bacterium]
MKIIISIFLFFCITFSQEKYSQIRVELSQNISIKKLASLGLAVDHTSSRKNHFVDFFINSDEMQILENNGIPFSIIIDDWNNFYNERQKSESKEKTLIQYSSEIIKNFRFGSMGGYFTLNEIYAELDSMRKYYPNLISKNDTLGFSVENRPIIGFKITNFSSQHLNKPKAFYNALHHAREPEGMMQLIYFIWYLMENFGIDEESTNILNKRELFFVLCVNPDGYFYNQTKNPNGGGMWRKNRKLNSGTTYGVDLNRNYGFNWGFNDVGSSPNMTSETYRGLSPFSEPETKAIRDFAIKNKFNVAFNTHTYSNLLIYPWGYNDIETVDSILFRSLAQELIKTNRYSYGTGIQTVGYNVNGDADDWLYGDTISKPKVISYTPEIGNHVDLFWPKKERILPLCLENLSMNLKMAHAAGEFINVKLISVDVINDSIKVSILLNNIGAQNISDNFNIKFKNISSIKYITTSDSVISNAKLNKPINLYFKINVDWFKANGHTTKIFFKIDGNDATSFDTISFKLGKPKIIFSDSAENGLVNWIATGDWNTSPIDKYSGLFSFTDSPIGMSQNNFSTSLTLKNYISLTPLQSSSIYFTSELRFFAKWHIEASYDFLKVQISTDSGKTWQSLNGKYTQQASGTAKQVPIYSPGYDGIMHNWVEEVIDLQQFVQKPAIKIRFLMETDAYESYDGFYLDNISILGYEQYVGSVNNLLIPDKITLYQNYPNPWNPKTTIKFYLPNKNNIKLILYDVLGREVKVLTSGEFNKGNHSINLDGKNISSGIYFIRLEAHNYFSTIKTFLSK